MRKIIILGIFLLVMLSFNVNAFGVSSPYWDENPLYVSPGETKEVTMYIQNMVGNEDITMIAKASGNTEIFTILDSNTNYFVPAGASNIPVHLKITIPVDAPPGKRWDVAVSFTTAPSPTGGGVGISGAVVKGFPVILKEEAKTTTTPKVSENLTGFIILVAILIVLVILFKQFYKRKNNKNV